MKCPRCHTAELVEGGPLSSQTCTRCGGGLIPEVGLQRLLDELKHTLAELRELAKLYGGARMQCPACRSKMSPIVLRGVNVNLCFGCGGLWLDKGELEAITSGRHVLPAPATQAPGAKAIDTPPPAQALVRIDERSYTRHITRAVLSAGGAVGIVWSMTGVTSPAAFVVGVAALASAALMSRQQTFDVLPRARRMVRWRGWFAPDPKNEARGGNNGNSDVVESVEFSPESCVVVRALRLPALAQHRKTPFVAVDLVDAEGRDVVRLKGPMLPESAWTEAPRYARALGVTVRFDNTFVNDDALDDDDARKTTLALAAHDVLHVVPADLLARRFTVRPHGDNAEPVATVSSEVPAQGPRKTLDDVLREHFTITDAGGEAVRLFSTRQLGGRATILVGNAGRVVGNITTRRTLFADTVRFTGPQGRRTATVVLRHGATEARIVDGHGRSAGVLEVKEAAPSEPDGASLHLFPGRLTGNARIGLVALAVHVCLAALVDDVD